MDETSILKENISNLRWSL